MTSKQHLSILQRIAHKAMLQRGLLPDLSAEALVELGRIQAPAAINGEQVHDLRGLLWASIDNDDSRDLDQLTVAEAMPGGKVKILVAVADVDSLVHNGSAIDEQARHNTTSVYTAGRIFPMLPEKLSIDLTSLNLNQDRLAIVVEMVIGAAGSRNIPSSHCYEEGELRVITIGPTFAGLVAESFNQIRGSATDNVVIIMMRMLGAFQTIASLTASPGRRQALREQLQWTARPNAPSRPLTTDVRWGLVKIINENRSQ